MTSSNGKLWERVPDGECDGLYDNAARNNLSPRFHDSIEDNELQAPTESQQSTKQTLMRQLQQELSHLGLHYLQKMYRNRRSLKKYSKEIGLIQRQILEHLTKQDKEDKVDVTIRSEFLSSETEPKVTCSSEINGTTHAQSENEIYSTRIQEGNNNLMFVCEPKTSQRACFKQVGNNNVMVNLHTSMISNCCQILNVNDGKVFQLDSDGEFWLEVKVRRNTSAVTPNSSNQYNDLNQQSASANANAEVPNEPTHFRTASENSEYSANSRSSTTSVESDWHNDKYDSKRISCEENDDDSTEDNVRVYDKGDAILVQVETPPGGIRLSDYSNLEECVPVKEALRHKKVKHFLQKQGNNFDFDVDVTNWEYEREQIYSIPEDLCPRHPYEEWGYSLVDGPPCTVKRTNIVRRPTLPPRAHKPSSPIMTDISRIFGEGKEELDRPNTTENPPDLPPRRYREPCEHSEQSSPHVSFPTDYLPTKPAELSIGVDDDLKSPTATGRSPIRELPPPPFAKRQQSSMQMKTHSLPESSWYHGKIDNEISKSLLTGKPTGSFLVRDSSDNTGSHKYTLEFVAENAVRRLKIMKKEEDSYHLKESNTTFETVEQLVEEAIKTGLEVRDSRRTNEWRMIKITPVERL